MWEYLSLYSEREKQETFRVKHYPEPGQGIAEDTLLAQLGADGWELVAVVPAYGGGGNHVNHQLYFKRPLRESEYPTTRLGR